MARVAHGRYLAVIRSYRARTTLGKIMDSGDTRTGVETADGARRCQGEGWVISAPLLCSNYLALLCIEQ